jgi:hypothetical protein
VSSRTGGRAQNLVRIGLFTALPPYRLTPKSPSPKPNASIPARRPPFNRHFWGIALVDDKGKLLYGRNADRLFVPGQQYQAGW